MNGTVTPTDAGTRNIAAAFGWQLFFVAEIKF
jgi:hypothetical protein